MCAALCVPPFPTQVGTPRTHPAGGSPLEPLRPSSNFSAGRLCFPPAVVAAFVLGGGNRGESLGVQAAWPGSPLPAHWGSSGRWASATALGDKLMGAPRLRPGVSLAGGAGLPRCQGRSERVPGRVRGSAAASANLTQSSGPALNMTLGSETKGLPGRSDRAGGGGLSFQSWPPVTRTSESRPRTSRPPP